MRQRTNKDWRGRAWYLERTFPTEFGRCAERPLPTVEAVPTQSSIAFVLNTGGKTLEELVNFPMCDGAPPPSTSEDEASTRRPIPTASGRVIWTDEPLPPDDADPNANVAED